MMKTQLTKQIGVVGLLLLSQTVFGQNQIQESSDKIWVTVPNAMDVPVEKDGRLISSNPAMQRFINDNNVITFSQALSASRTPELQQVYEVGCFCNNDDLIEAVALTQGMMQKPERAPEYNLLVTPDDYNIHFANDYALDLINAQGAWDITTGDTNIIVGVNDGGFFTAHEELQGKYVYNDSNPYWPNHYKFHGTAVAITAAGRTDNGIGKSSIGYNCKLSLATMSFNKVLHQSYNGAHVLNLSWASGCYANWYIQAIVNEVYNNGTILVASAGNGGTCGGSTRYVFPASCEHVISVSSVGPWDNHERTIGNPNTTHQHNDKVDICAPGYDVALSVRPGWYLTGNGTSFASPYVAGTIGLMLSVAPCLSFEDVEYILKATAVNIDAQNPTYAGLLGAGRMDAGAAVAMAASFCDDGNNGHGDDPGKYDPSNPGNGNGGPGNNGGGNGNVSGNTGVTIGTLQQNGNGRAPEAGEMNTAVQDFKVKVYPNPTQDNATIRWESNEELDVVITNIQGQTIYEGTLLPEEQFKTFTLPESGIYLIKVANRSGATWTEKVVRLK